VAVAALAKKKDSVDETIVRSVSEVMGIKGLEDLYVSQ